MAPLATGKASHDVHHLLKTLAEARVRKMELQRGSFKPQEHLGVVTGDYRRIVSVACVRAQAECLLSRLNQVGEGMTAANNRRKQVAIGWPGLRGEGVYQGKECLNLIEA